MNPEDNKTKLKNRRSRVPAEPAVRDYDEVDLTLFEEPVSPRIPEPKAIPISEDDEILARYAKSPDEDFLTRFQRQIFAEQGIGWGRLNYYITMYQRDVRRRDPNRTSKMLGSDRGNIIKELERGTMTFKNFMGKLRLIRTCKLELTVKLTNDKGEVHTHTISYRDATVPEALDGDDFANIDISGNQVK